VTKATPSRSAALARHHDVSNDEVLHAVCPIVATPRSDRRSQVRHMARSAVRSRTGRSPRRHAQRPLALDATFVAPRDRGRREIAARVFTSLFETALAHDRSSPEIRVPHEDRGMDYLKFNRRAPDWALRGVAAVQANAGARVALTNMGLTPIRATGSRTRSPVGRSRGRLGPCRRGHEPALGCVRVGRVPALAREGAREAGRSRRRWPSRRRADAPLLRSPDAAGAGGG